MDTLGLDSPGANVSADPGSLGERKTTNAPRDAPRTGPKQTKFKKNKKDVDPLTVRVHGETIPNARRTPFTYPIGCG